MRRVIRTHGRSTHEILIRNVPMVACSNCRERYFTAATLREVDRIRRHWRTLSVERPVRVAVFAKR